MHTNLINCYTNCAQTLSHPMTVARGTASCCTARQKRQILSFKDGAQRGQNATQETPLDMRKSSRICSAESMLRPTFTSSAGEAPDPYRVILIPAYPRNISLKVPSLICKAPQRCYAPSCIEHMAIQHSPNQRLGDAQTGCTSLLRRSRVTSTIMHNHH